MTYSLGNLLCILKAYYNYDKLNSTILCHFKIFGDQANLLHDVDEVFKVEATFFIFVSHFQHTFNLICCDLFTEVMGAPGEILGRDEPRIVIIIDPKDLPQLLLLVPAFDLLGHECHKLLFVDCP